MYLLPGSPFSQAVEAYRDSGVKRFVQRACTPWGWATPLYWSTGTVHAGRMSTLHDPVCV